LFRKKSNNGCSVVQNSNKESKAAVQKVGGTAATDE